jgi:hypothetical protein
MTTQPRTKAQELDASAYIVHAANSYPRLVEALRTVLLQDHSAPDTLAARQDARALLRSLGEIE